MCKHYKDDKCYSQRFLDALGWPWLKEQGYLEVPTILEFECPVRTCGFIRRDHSCNDCKYFEGE